MAMHIVGRALRRASAAALELLMPLRCVSCGREGAYICGACAPRLPVLRRPFCHICAAPNVPQLCDGCRQYAPSFDSVRAPFVFDGAVREMVYDLKYRGVRIAAPHMASLLADYLRRNPYPVDALTAVPLHSRRERRRGYNQSALIAQGLSALTGIPLRTDALRRIRNTPPQVSMGTSGERRRNIVEAFECPAAVHHDVAGRNLMLIDDVVTTSSTMSACANALKDAGASHVWGIAFARQGAPNAAADDTPTGGADTRDATRLWV